MIEQTVFALLSIIIYTYAIFPAICILRGRFFPEPWKCESVQPSVSIVIICHNEADVIEQKLNSLCDLHYPRERIEVIVGSDGSDDETEKIVSDYSRLSVKLLSYTRRGKIPALNDAVQHASGEILVFTDANSDFDPEALQNLVRHFADPTIGCVAGNQVYSKGKKSGSAAAGEKSYWNYDRILKEAESAAGNAISATGAIYAIRHQLFQRVPSGVTDDFTISTRVILQGFRLVFDKDAIASEPVAGKPKAEFRRKVRVMTRGFRAVWTVKALLNPAKYGFYSVQFFSHKLLRRLVAFPILLLLLLTPLLWQQGGWLADLAVVQWIFYLSAFAGVLFEDRLGKYKAFSIPLFFCLANVAAINAALNFLSGRTIETWDSPRPVPHQVSSHLTQDAGAE